MLIEREIGCGCSASGESNPYGEGDDVTRHHALRALEVIGERCTLLTHFWPMSCSCMLLLVAVWSLSTHFPSFVGWGRTRKFLFPGGGAAAAQEEDLLDLIKKHAEQQPKIIELITEDSRDAIADKIAEL